MSDPELIPAMKHPAADVLRLLRLRWWVVALLGLAGSAAAVVYYVCMPQWYEAELLIIPSRNPAESSPARNLLSSLPFDLSSASPFGQSDAERIAVILQSRSVTDEIIAKFDLPAGTKVNAGDKFRYVYHCHILEHEENEMMRPFDVIG